jgi:hypothetical protein
MIAPFYGQDLLGGPHRSYMPVHDWKKLMNNKGEGLLIGIEHFDNVPGRGASFVGHVPCLEMQAAFSFMVSVPGMYELYIYESYLTSHTNMIHTLPFPYDV